MEKLKLAVYWAAGCGGCEMTILELHEKILDLLERFDIVFWPCLMDIKYADLERMPDGSIDVCFINGAVRNEENADIARLLRRKSKVLIAFGACAAMGGVPGLANLYPMADIFRRAFLTSESTVNPGGVLPAGGSGEGAETALPPLTGTVKAVHQVVKVDYLMPGCPPTEDQTWAVCEAAYQGALPPRGAVVGAGAKAVCDECPLEKKQTRISAFKRPHEVIPDGKTCLLEQGLICLGPATRSGCQARCLTVGITCRGCYGPAGDALDQGAKMIAALGTACGAEGEEEIHRLAGSLVDPAGTFYRYTLPASVMHGWRERQPSDSGETGESSGADDSKEHALEEDKH